MATWKAANSMLTQRGVEILNKIKSGSGSITITRIVASSGRVDESRLFHQIELKGETKIMEISRHNISGNGSEISVNITNMDYAEDFEIQQIGIFVTHPDYIGEQLYHISQCDEGSSDIIPASGDTPVTLGYSLFLEHGNSSSINITVNPQGMITKEEFDNFVKNAVVGNIFTIDENKRLVDTGVSASILGSSSENLLHNWYFKNPVDQKLGYVAPPNTKYYNDLGLTSGGYDTTQYYKATILSGNPTVSMITIGSSTYYVSTADIVRGYVNNFMSIDRWRLNNGTGGVTSLAVENDGVKLVLSKSNGLFTQDVGSTIPTHYVGRTYTLSVNVLSRAGGNPSLYVNTGSTILSLPITNIGVTSYTFTLPVDATKFIVGLYNPATSASTIKVTSMKLEVGSNSSLAHDPPANFAEQMVLCIQFDPTTDVYKGFPAVSTANTVAEATLGA